MHQLKNSIMTRLISLLLLMSVQGSEASTYIFKPFDWDSPKNDINDLVHQDYYSWKIQWTMSAGETISAASLVFFNIWDWTREEDALYIYLLDTPPSLSTTIRADKTVIRPGYSLTTSLYRGSDNQGGGDYFSGQGELLTPVWNDPLGGNPRSLNLIYDLAHLDGTIAPDGSIIPGPKNILPLLNSFASDGVFGFGIDPDCHYYNDQIGLMITTTSILEPSTVRLFGGGLLGLVAFRKELNPLSFLHLHVSPFGSSDTTYTRERAEEHHAMLDY